MLHAVEEERTSAERSESRESKRGRRSTGIVKVRPSQLTSLLPTTFIETEFDPFLSQDGRIQCSSLDNTDRQQAFLLQQCPCDYTWNGQGFEVTVQEQNRLPNYTTTRFAAPSPSGTSRAAQAVGCIPFEFATQFEGESGSVPNLSLGETRTYLTRNATLFRQRPEFETTLVAANREVSSILRFVLEKLEPLASFESRSCEDIERYASLVNEVNREFLNRTQTYRRNVSEALRHFNLEDNSTVQQALQIEERPTQTNRAENPGELRRIQRNLQQTRPNEDWSNLDSVRRWIEEEKVRRLLERYNARVNEPVVEAASLSVQWLNSTVDASRRRVEECLRRESQTLTQAIHQSISDFRDYQSRQENQNSTSGEQALHEFLLVNRFPESTSEDATTLIGDNYRPVATVPVPELTSISGFDYPATFDYWPRWLLLNYSSQKVPFERSSLSSYLEGEEKIVTPLGRISIPNNQFLNIIRQGLESGVITRSDLALAQFSRSLWVGTTTVSPEIISLLPQYVREVLQQFLSISDRQQKLAVRQENLRGTIRLLLGRLILLTTLPEQLVRELTTPQVPHPEFPNQVFTPFLTTQDASEFIEVESTQGENYANVDELQDVARSLVESLVNTESEVNEVADVDLSKLVRSVKYAISNYLGTKRWPSQSSMEEFA